MLPNVVARYCTAELKIRTINRYLQGELEWTSRWTTAIGIRADEPRRVRPSTEHKVYWYPLAGANVTNEDVLAFWSGNDFDLELPVVNGKTLLGNCDGCFLKSEANLAELYRSHPERYAWWRKMETHTNADTGLSKGTFRASGSYKDLASFVDTQGEMIFSNEAFLCQADSGECTWT